MRLCDWELLQKFLIYYLSLLASTTYSKLLDLGLSLQYKTSRIILQKGPYNIIFFAQVT